MDNRRHGYESVIPVGFTARFILFFFLASYGIRNILLDYRYWFIIVPQGGLDPLWISPWRQLADLLMSISSLGMITLGIDLISTDALRNRHRKGLAMVLLIFGASRIILISYFDSYMISHGGLRLFNLMDIIPYVWGAGFLDIGYRLYTEKPNILKSTFVTVAIVFGAELLRQLFQLNQVITNSGFHLRQVTNGLIHTISTLSAFIFSVYGIQEKWSVETLFNRGIPLYFKAGLITYGIHELFFMVWILLSEPEILKPLVRDPVSLLIYLFAVLNGLALVAAALYPWKNLRNTHPTDPHEQAMESG